MTGTGVLDMTGTGVLDATTTYPLLGSK